LRWDTTQVLIPFSEWENFWKAFGP
jgi:hypothetical protein